MPISEKAWNPVFNNTYELGEKGNLFSLLFKKKEGLSNFHFQANMKTILNR